MPPETVKLRENIREAARFILEDTDRETRQSFERNRRLRQSVERGFEIIGEATRRLSHHDSATARRVTSHQRIISFRNHLIHGYDDVDHRAVWEIVQRWLPVLLTEVEALLREAAQDERAG